MRHLLASYKVPLVMVSTHGSVVPLAMFIISLFETRSPFVFSQSCASRRDREFVLSNLEFQEGERNKKGYLVVERKFSLLNLTRFFEIEKSHHALPGTLAEPEAGVHTLQRL